MEPKRTNWNLHLPLISSILDEAEDLKKNLVSFTYAYPRTHMNEGRDLAEAMSSVLLLSGEHADRLAIMFMNYKSAWHPILTFRAKWLVLYFNLPNLK